MSDPTYRKLRLVLGDQLHSGHSWFEQTDAEVLYVMMEIRPETDYVRHHIQKVAGFFAAMRRFKEAKVEGGHTFRYFRIGDPANLQDFQKNIEQLIEEFPSIEAVEYQEPDEYRLDVYFRNAPPRFRSLCMGSHPNISSPTAKSWRNSLVIAPT